MLLKWLWLPLFMMPLSAKHWTFVVQDNGCINTYVTCHVCNWLDYGHNLHRDFSFIPLAGPHVMKNLKPPIHGVHPDIGAAYHWICVLFFMSNSVFHSSLPQNLLIVLLLPVKQRGHSTPNQRTISNKIIAGVLRKENGVSTNYVQP